MTTRDKVERLLVNYPQTRDNDNLLIAYFMKSEYGLMTTFEIAQKFTTNVYESIRRARQKVMEENPALRPKSDVYEARLEKERRVREELRREQLKKNEQLLKPKENVAQKQHKQAENEKYEQIGIGLLGGHNY